MVSFKFLGPGTQRGLEAARSNIFSYSSWENERTLAALSIPSNSASLIGHLPVPSTLLGTWDGVKVNRFVFFVEAPS
jgi:hypothetical protein